MIVDETRCKEAFSFPRLLSSFSLASPSSSRPAKTNHIKLEILKELQKLQSKSARMLQQRPHGAQFLEVSDRSSCEEEPERSSQPLRSALLQTCKTLSFELLELKLKVTLRFAG